MAEEKQKSTSKLHLIKNLNRIISETTQGIKSNSHQSPDVGNDLMAWVMDDSDLRAGVEKKHSKINEIGYFLKGSEKNVKLAEKKLKSCMFDEWYDDSWWSELIFKNSFTEYGSLDKGADKSLNLIKVDEVEIVNTIKGKILNYLQIPTNPDGKTNAVVTIPANRVFHCTYDKMLTSLWGQSSLKTLIPILHRKRLLEDFLAWLIESNQFRSVIKIPSGVQDDDIEAYMEMLKNGMLNPTNFLVVQGDEAQVSSLRTFEGFVELLKLLSYYQGKINKALQLPPLEMGDVESSNRSSSEYQVRYAYYSHIKYLLARKAKQINSKLFPLLGITNVQFVPKLVDDVSVKDLLDNGTKLLGMNANAKKLNKWLIDQGLDIPEDLLEEPPDELAGLTGSLGQDSNKNKSKSKVKLDKNSDQHPSRQKTQMDMAGGSRKS